MTIPNRNDVLFGRGFSIGNHPGNQQLRNVVRARNPAFDAAKKKEKRMIARQIVEDIKNLDPPGRFLIEDPSSAAGNDATDEIMAKAWIIVEEEKAVNKVMHRLREREKVAAGVQDPKVPSQRQKKEKPLSVDRSPLIKNSPHIVHEEGAMDSHDNVMFPQQDQSQSSDVWASFLQNMQQAIDCEIRSSGIESARNVDNEQHASSQCVVGINNSALISRQSGNLQQMNNLKVRPTLRDIGLSSDGNVVNQSILRTDDLQEANGQQVETTDRISDDDNDIENAFDQKGGGHQSDVNDFDKDVDSFFHEYDNDIGNFDNKDPHVKSIALQLHKELTLREWIERSKVATIFAHAEYVRLALPVALKLTECLVETESDGVRAGCDAGIPMPLTSIVVENVYVTERPTAAAALGWEGEEGGAEVLEAIEFVRIKRITDDCSTEDCSDTSGVMNRLFFLGVIMYEIFSGGDEVQTPLNEGVDPLPHHLDLLNLSINSADLNEYNDESNCRNQTNYNIHQSRPRKKSQRQTSTTKDIHECCVANLESLGIPYSLCSLVKNLLDCGRGSFCGDDAFRSFTEVKLDLELMLTEPSRFLDNIETTNRMPSLVIRNKLYGREYEIDCVESSYRQLKDGTCSGIIISGEPGVGKSMLAMHVRELTIRTGGYFLGAKFDQNSHVNPLSKISLVFNSLCDFFGRDATPSQLKSAGEALRLRLGSQAFRLTASLPSLSKLLLPSVENSSGSACVNYALSTRFLFTELLDVISAHSMRPISIFFDDVQFAADDSTSLSLLGSLVSSIEGSKSIFFTCCYRDNQVGDFGPLDAWLGGITGFSLTSIKLGNLTFDGVNNLLSDALHLSPRITRPLASVLLNKTRGNCLFLLQLLESLKDQCLIYFNLSSHRWAWDLKKVMDLEITNDVVVLLIEEMRRLPADLQLGLRIASCLGSYVKYSVLDILSRDLGMNLLDSLRLVSKKGFMRHDSGGSSFTFVHDKIQQAAKEMMSEQQRHQLHMQLGLAICSYTLDNETKNDELFFVSVNQINCGGKGVLSDPNQSTMIAALNLKAGKLAITCSDFNAALKLFEHGISFLENDHWQNQYVLSLDLFDSAAGAACVTNDSRAVRLYADQILMHARCFSDKLNCLYSTTKALRQANRLIESMQSTFSIIEQCGEELPHAIDEKVTKDMMIMNATLQKMTDESILSTEYTMDKRTILLMKLYAELANTLHWINPSLIGAVSLRLADLTLKNGLTPLCPLAFVHFCSALANMGNEFIADGCRLGRLALKLSDRADSCVCKSGVIFFAYQSVLWAAVPLPAIADAHRQGHKVGERSGDYLYSTLNYFTSNIISYFAGENLSTMRKELRDSFLKMQGKSHQSFIGWGNMSLTHLQYVILQDGEERLNEERVDDVPGLKAVMVDSGKPDATVSMLDKILFVQRLFFFRRFDDISFDAINISEEIFEKKHFLRPQLLLGIFFEGLLAFQCARRESNHLRKEEWMRRGESASKRMMCLSDHLAWNWENKSLLLIAEKLYTDGNFDQAASCYDKAVRSANEHRFIHEEAMACELAGDFYYERNSQKSYAFFVHSIECYMKWGAFAVARRVESSLGVRSGSYFAQLEPNKDCLEAIYSSRNGHSKKRQDI